MIIANLETIIEYGKRYDIREVLENLLNKLSKKLPNYERGDMEDYIKDSLINYGFEDGYAQGEITGESLREIISSSLDDLVEGYDREFANEVAENLNDILYL